MSSSVIAPEVEAQAGGCKSSVTIRQPQKLQGAQSGTHEAKEAVRQGDEDIVKLCGIAHCRHRL